MSHGDASSRSVSCCIVSITGVGCAGKSTLARHLNSKIAGSQIIHQDDYFRSEDYEHHIKVPGMEMSNWEVVNSVDFDKLLTAVKNALQNLTPSKHPTLIIEGHLILNEPRIFEISDVKYCLTMNKEECWERRQHKYYGSHDSFKYFNECAWPEYQKRLEEMTELNSQTNQDDSFSKIKFVPYNIDIDQLCNQIFSDVISVCKKKTLNNAPDAFS